jgi:DNA-binding NarL/FixJ family response regulator
MNILIAEDHPIIVDSITRIIKKKFNQAEVLSVEFSKQILEYITTYSITHLILDIHLNDGNALKVLDTLKLQNKTLPIMIFTTNQIQGNTLPYTKWDIWGIVNKAITATDLRKVITNFITQEDEYTIQSEHIIRFKGIHKNEVQQNTLVNSLSNNELQVMDLLLNRTSIKEIAFLTNNKSSTIATYKKRIFRKLGVNSLLELEDLMKK